MASPNLQAQARDPASRYLHIPLARPPLFQAPVLYVQPVPEAAEAGGPTERLIRAAFATTALITAKAAATLLGVDVKTLRGMTNEGMIQAVRRGRLHAYTEAAIRKFLTEEMGQQCRSTSRRRAASSSTISNIKVVDFTVPRARKRAARPRK